MSFSCNPNTPKKTTAAPKPSIHSLFTDYELVQYNRVVNYALGQIFMKYVSDSGWVVSDLNDIKKAEAVYAGVKTFINNMIVQKHKNVAGSMWLKLSDEAKQGLFKVYKNWDVYASYHMTYNSIFSVGNSDFEEENEEMPEEKVIAQEEEGTEESAESILDNLDTTEELSSKEKHDRIGNEDSQFELAAKSLKTLFKLLPKMEFVNGQVQEVLDRNGLPSSAETLAVWNLLMERTQGEKDFSTLKKILQDDKTRRIIPEVDFIYKALRLDKNPSDLTSAEMLQIMSFYQRFTKPKVPIKSLYKNKDGNLSLINEILGNVQKIEKQFQHNFLVGTHSEKYKAFIKLSPSGVYYLLNPDKDTRLPSLNTLEDKIEFLRMLGITFSNTEVMTPEETAEMHTLINEEAPRLQDTLSKMMELREPLPNPLEKLKKGFMGFKGRNDSIKKLVEFESRFSKVAPTHSSNNSVGEKQHLIAQDSALSVATYYLNSAQTLTDLYKTPAFRNSIYNPQFANSYIINFLFDEKGNKRPGRTINLELLSGYKAQSEDSTVSVLERSLSDRAKFIQDFGMFLTNGRTDVMRTETSHSFYMLGLYNNKAAQKIVDPKGFDTFFASEAFINRIMHYLNGEIARINSYEAKKKEGDRLGYKIPPAFNEFSIFSEVFEKGKNEELKKELLKAGTVTSDSPLFQQFTAEYEKVLNKELANFEKDINRRGITAEELFPAQLKNIYGELEFNSKIRNFYRAFIAGNLIQNVEFSILFTGDTLFIKDLHKRLKGLASTGNIAATIDLLNAFFKSQPELNLYNQYSLGGAMNVKKRDNGDTFHTQTLKEQGKRAGFYYDSPGLESEMKASLKLGGRDDKVLKEYLDYIKTAASDVKIADGQGYLNLDFHREIGYRFEFWNDNMEKAYKYEGLVFRKEILGQKLSDAQQKELEDLEKEIYENPEAYALPVLKVTYWGGLENVKLDARAYDKLSLSPILPSVARNHPELKNLMMQMVAGQYGYVKYESGTKGFKTNPVTSLKSASPDLYNTQLLKEQIKTKSTHSVSTSIPTQLKKLIISNLFSGGKASKEATSLYNNYISTLKDIQKLQIQKVFEDLGITSQPTAGSIDEQGTLSIDTTKLATKLYEEAKSRQMNSNILSALKVKDGQFVVAPEASGVHEEISNLISGIVDRELRRYELPGGDFVLVSNAHMSQLPFYKFSKDGTKAMGIRITLTKEFSKLLNQLHPDGKRIRTLDRLNESLGNQKWRDDHEKSITVILDRVPTDGIHSMDFAQIHEFISPTAGNQVILPDEVVIKVGADFDYDKLKVLIPSLTKSGEYIHGVESVEEELSALKKEYPELLTNLHTPSELEQAKEVGGKVETFKTSISALSSFIKDMMDKLNKGRFSELNTVPGELVDITKDQFMEIVNLEIAKDYLGELLSTFKPDEVSGESRLPSVEFRDFSAQQFEDMRVELDNLTGAYYTDVLPVVKKEILAVKNKAITLMQKRGRLFEQKANDLITSYSSMLSSPELFADLVSPTTSAMVKDAAEKFTKLSKDDMTLPSQGRVFYHSENLKVFKTFFDSKNLLGAFAIDNTFQQLLSHLGININTTFFTKARFKDENYRLPQIIHNRLLTKAEQSRVMEDGKILTSLRDDIEGYMKQMWNGQIINATVDAAKDPFFALLHIVWDNIGIVNFMKNMGVPFDRIVNFINNPALRHYFELRQNGLSPRAAKERLFQNRYPFIKKLGNVQEIYVSKEDYFLSAEQLIAKGILPKGTIVLPGRTKVNDSYIIKIQMVSRPSSYDIDKIFREVDNDVAVSDYTMLNNYRTDAKELTPASAEELVKPENNWVAIPTTEKEKRRELFWNEFRLLANFFQLQHAAWAFRDFQRYFNFDTKKVSTPLEVRQKEKLRAKIIGQGLFSKADVEKMEQSSIIAPFINNKVIDSTFSNVFEILSNRVVQSGLAKLYDMYDSPINPKKTKKGMRTFPAVLTGDFITSVLFSYGQVDGKNLMTGYRYLLVKEKDKQTIVERFIDFKKKPYFDSLAKQFPVLDRLISNKHSVGNPADVDRLYGHSIQNLQLIKNIGETLLEQEDVIEQFTTLYYNFKYNKGTEEQQQKVTEEVRSFMKDLFIAGILQSGVGKTFIGFQEYIPLRFKGPIFQEAINKFKDLNDEAKGLYMSTNMFMYQFQKNNPNFFEKFTIVDGQGVSQEWAFTNDYADRLKIYHIPIQNAAKTAAAPQAANTVSNTPVFDTLPSRSGTPTMTYAGIGSRETPPDVLARMTEVAKELEKRGYTLRSGHALGADQAFEKGVASKKEIFPGDKKAGEKEHQIAREIHPNPYALDKAKNPAFVWNLMARNTNQIFGENLDSPVDFVLAWTKDGLTHYSNRSLASGGTGQAIDMASRKGIPVINMFNDNWKEQLRDVLGMEKKQDDTVKANKVEAPVENKEETPEAPKINIYSGDKNGFEKLSNLLNGPVEYEGQSFNTVEHLYQWMKADFAGDEASKSKIIQSPTGFAAQKAGRQVNLRDTKGWDAISYDKLKEAMTLAFQQNEEARNLLLSTGNTKLTHTSTTGANLGRWTTDFPKLLMEIRDELQPEVEGDYLPEEIKAQLEREWQGQRNVVVPEGSSHLNYVIFEDENNSYLMNDGQQAAYNKITQFVVDRFANRPKDIDLDGDKAVFTTPLAKHYSNMYPKDMWDNMIGLIGKGGVGKTTVIKKIVDDLFKNQRTNKYSRAVISYVTPTHTAATVLQESLGYDSEGTKTGNVNTMAAFVGRKIPSEDGQDLLMMSTKDYQRDIKNDIRTPIITHDVIIVDESSMISKGHIKDLLRRMREEKELGLTGNPVFIFMGDYRQLPDVSDAQNPKSNPEIEGAVSSTLFISVSKTAELTQIMRSSDKDMHAIFDSVGRQIEKRRQAFTLRQQIPRLDLTEYDNLTRRSSKNVLVVNSVEGVIDDYVNYLTTHNNPYDMFWVHYNKLAHENTKELFVKIRKAYFNKLGVTSVPEHFIKNDYVQFTGPMEMSTSEIPKLKIEIGTIKPQSRYKVLDIIQDTVTLGQYLPESIAAYFDSDKTIDVMTTVLYNRQNKIRGVRSLDGYRYQTKVDWIEKPTLYGKSRKSVIITIFDKAGNEVQKSKEIPGNVYMQNESTFFALFTSIYTMFSPSYIGSSHTAQGNSIKQVIVGDYNIKQNLAVVGEKDISSSLYTALTRASKKLIIIKPRSFQIENNQEEYQPYSEEIVKPKDSKNIKLDGQDYDITPDCE